MFPNSECSFQSTMGHALSWQTGNSRAKHTLGCRGRIYCSCVHFEKQWKTYLHWLHCPFSWYWWWGLEWWDGFGFSSPRPSRCGHFCACVVGRSTPEEGWSRWRKWEWIAGWCSWWLMACNCSDLRQEVTVVLLGMAWLAIGLRQSRTPNGWNVCHFLSFQASFRRSPKKQELDLEPCHREIWLFNRQLLSLCGLMVGRSWISASISPKKCRKKPTLNIIEAHPHLLTLT